METHTLDIGETWDSSLWVLGNPEGTENRKARAMKSWKEN